MCYNRSIFISLKPGLNSYKGVLSRGVFGENKFMLLLGLFGFEIHFNAKTATVDKV